MKEVQSTEQADENIKDDVHWFMKGDALIRFNFGNYPSDTTFEDWAIMWNQLAFIKDKKD